ncbi:DUF4160 domain-containing protein [Oleomonas cavernae]|uniref:DUF4160 domain-containing protein n=1 Tax=Oleomonas cavernae TaxID=2320859 RepID=A0A418WCU7_9PROT|nr:DUF4160 domain-containing protein [Oleomonas cavernae]RJF87853.1 DUF4160 domain-containing protein [Oleomonas cavernae]
MPTVLRLNGYRFYFYSHEPNEPPHVHIDKGGSSAKYWLEIPALARNLGFDARTLREMLEMVRHHRAMLLEAWHGHFSNGE